MGIGGRLLITGATGFLGGYLVRRLDAVGQPFEVLARSTSDLTQLRALPYCHAVHYGDLTGSDGLPSALRGVDTVIHAGASVSFRRRDAQRMMRVNAGGTQHLLDEMQRAGVRRLIYLSSVAALDRRSGGRPTGVRHRAADPTRGSGYARSKRAAERAVTEAQDGGLSVSVLYPAVILGAGDWMGHNTPSLWRHCAGELPFYPGGRNGFVAVEDVVDGILRLLWQGKGGERWLLSAEEWRWRDILRTIARHIGARPPLLPLPPALSLPLAYGAERWADLTGGRPVLTVESNRNAQADYRYLPTAVPGGYRDIGGVLQRVSEKYLEDRGR